MKRHIAYSSLFNTFQTTHLKISDWLIENSLFVIDHQHRQIVFMCDFLTCYLKYNECLKLVLFRIRLPIIFPANLSKNPVERHFHTWTSICSADNESLTAPIAALHHCGGSFQRQRLFNARIHGKVNVMRLIYWETDRKSLYAWDCKAYFLLSICVFVDSWNIRLLLQHQYPL